MAGSNDFTGQNIQDTYQRVLQISSSGALADGTGSLVPIIFVTASHAISSSIEILKEVSSSNADTASYIQAVNIEQPFTHITASGIISASGTVKGLQYSIQDQTLVSRHPVGGIAIGNTSDVTDLTGANIILSATVTASGDISASGEGHFSHVKIPQGADASVASIYFGDTPTSNAGAIYDDGDNLQIGYNDVDVLAVHDAAPQVNIMGKVLINGGAGHITASGNISASGEIRGTGGRFSDAASGVSLFIGPGTGLAAGTNFVGHTSHPMQLNASTISTNTLAPTSFIIRGNVTASKDIITGVGGNISASGNIHGDTYTIDANKALASRHGSGHITLGNGDDKLILNSNGQIAIEGHITASGNISASGNITSSQINATGTGVNYFEGNIDLVNNDNMIRKDTGQFIKFTSTAIQFQNTVQVANFTNGEAVFNDGHHSSQDFRVEGDTKTHLLFVDASEEKVGIGRGSALTSVDSTLDVTGDLTVSSDITASAEISGSTLMTAASASISVLKGNDISTTGLAVSGFISATDITASGDISASGLLYGTDLYISNKEFIDYSPNDNIYRVSGDATPIKFFTSIEAINITASGNISASGGNIAANFPDTNVDASHYPLVTTGQNGTIESQNSLHLNPFTSGVTFQGDITASGNISSSGEVITNTLRLTAGVNDYIVGSGTSVNIKSADESIRLIGDVTASGNISASRTITAPDYMIGNRKFAGVNSTDQAGISLGNDGAGNLLLTHLTASGDISASGRISADNLFLDAGSFDIRTGNTYTFNPSSGTGTISFDVGVSNQAIIISNKRLAITNDEARLELGTVTTPTNVTASGHISSSHNYIGSRQFNIPGATDNSLTQGDIIYYGNEGSIATGDIVYLKSDGTWNKSDADFVARATALHGIALGSDASVDGILLRGMYTLDHDLGDTQAGVPLYLSDTEGRLTATAPSSTGQVVRIMGYQLGDDDQIWFDPDKSWVELT